MTGLVVACSMAAVLGRQAPPASQPVFSAGAERVIVDATVVTDAGAPIEGLEVGDFVLRVDGRPRRITSVDYASAQGSAEPATTEEFSSNAGTGDARPVLLLIDQGNLRAAVTRTAVNAANALLQRLPPADRIGVIAFPRGAQIDFTTNRAAAAATLTRVVGLVPSGPGRRNVSVAEALSIENDDGLQRQMVMTRECASEADLTRQACEQAVETEARSTIALVRDRTDTSLRMLRSLFTQLRKLPGQKVVVWISEGLYAGDQEAEIVRLADAAAASRTTVYALHVDPAGSSDAAGRRMTANPADDRAVMRSGMELLASAARGALLSTGGSPDAVAARIASEMSGHYLLGMEPEPGDRDGKPHEISLQVRREHAIVRARRRFVLSNAPTTAPAAAGGEAGVRSLLESPVVVADLPLKVATFVVGPDGSKGRVLIGAELGAPTTASAQAAIGYIVQDEQGKTVGSGFDEVRVDPLVAGTASPLQHTALVPLPVGHYVLRLAAIDESGRRGSVEHRFTVPEPSGAPSLGSLVLAPVNESGGLRPAADPLIEGPFLAYAAVQGVGESAVRNAQGEIEVAAGVNAPALVKGTASFTVARDTRRVALQAPVPTDWLPPGTYIARLTATIGSGTPIAQWRRFRLPRVTAVPQSSWSDLQQRLVPRFQLAQLLSPEAVAAALDRALAADGAAVTPALRAAADGAKRGRLDEAGLPSSPDGVTLEMLRGLARLTSGKLEEAAAAFRAAIRRNSEFMTATTYLGACYAAGGRMREAVGAWQTALVLETDSPIIYRLAADGLAELDDLDAAVDLLTEAVAQWPDDRELAARLALARASGGDAGAAFDSLAPLIDAVVRAGGILDDLLARISIAASVQQAGAASQQPTALATYVEALQRAGRTPPAIVSAWVRYLEAR